MIRRAPFILMALAGALLAQSGISPPLAGFLRCEDGKLRPVYGLAGNFVLGAPIAQETRTQPLRNGRTTLSLPGGALLLAEENGLVYRKADGAELRTPLDAPVLRIERMSDTWIHVRVAGKSLAVRLAGERLEVYRLPEAAE
jgi:hypothetical protein